MHGYEYNKDLSFALWDDHMWRAVSNRILWKIFGSK